MNPIAAIGAWWTRSIRWKLVGIFIVICVVPMLVVTDVTSNIVAATFRNSVETWLFQTTQFFAADILDERDEVTQAANTLVEEGSLLPLLSGANQPLPKLLKRMLDNFDILLIFDDQDKVVYSSGSVANISEIPAVSGPSIYLYQSDKQAALMTSGTRHLIYQGRSYNVLIGSLIDQNFINNMSKISSLTIELYYQSNDEFIRVYSNQSPGTQREPRRFLPKFDAGAATDDKGYVSANEPGDEKSVGIYTPFIVDGKVVGLLYCGLSSEAGLAGWVTRQNLFIAIFALGMLLSGGAGYIMSRLLTGPVAQLANGVKAIAKGDYTQRIPVARKDELGQLASAFNSMARQLQGLRKIEAKLRRREQMTTLGEVAAGLAHEIRNPLGIIKTSAELLEKNDQLTGVEKRRLGYVIDEVRRINQLITDFLAFAKPPQRMTEIAPGDLITRAIGICQSEIERQAVEVLIDDESEGATVILDPDQMIQACLNLVLNALQAMEEAPGPSKLTIGITAEEDEVHLFFADNGPGIPPHIIDRVFDPFVTTKHAGTGLGLAKVFAVAEGHGGWVEVSNAVQGGAVFKLVIPRAERRSDDVSHHSDR